MPDLFEIIESTRAMRRLKPDPVPDELIAKILRAGSCAPNGGNTQKWRFLIIKDPKIKKAVQVWYKKAFDEVIGPRYLTSAPPPGVTKEKYLRQHAAVEYLTDHFHEAPVWIVAVSAVVAPSTVGFVAMMISRTPPMYFTGVELGEGIAKMRQELEGA
jgi:nitroreductase